MKIKTTKETLNHIHDLALAYQNSDGGGDDEFKKYRKAIAAEAIRIAKEMVGSQDLRVHSYREGISYYYELSWVVSKEHGLASVEVQVSPCGQDVFGPFVDFDASVYQRHNRNNFKLLSDIIEMKNKVS